MFRQSSKIHILLLQMLLGHGKTVGNAFIAPLKSLSLSGKGSAMFQIQHLQVLLAKGRFLLLPDGQWDVSVPSANTEAAILPFPELQVQTPPTHSTFDSW